MTVDTRAALVENAIALVRTRGYAAFSYADLAETVGIRKPSIHHHFPSKEDLGVAIVDAYAREFMGHLEAVDASKKGVAAKLLGYAALYRESLTSKQGCLCGVLASEMSILPPRVQTEVQRFFNSHLDWIERVLREGQKQGAVRTDDPSRTARSVLATLQGALFLALALGKPRSFDDAVGELLAGLGATTIM